MIVDPKKIEHAMQIASEDVIALEPKLTEWDTVSGNVWTVVADVNERLSEMVIVEKRVRMVRKPLLRL